MLLVVSALTWLSLLVGSVAVCRAAAYGDGVQAGLGEASKDGGAEAHIRSPLVVSGRGHAPSMSSPATARSGLRREPSRTRL
jgi:hypothetical protein